MDSKPHATPAENPAVPLPGSHGLKRRSVLVMLVFMIVTLGLYYVAWWFRRRPGLNRLNSPKKLAAWPLLMVTALFTIQFGLAFAAGATPVEEVIGAGTALLLTLFQYAVAIVMIVQAFKVKDMIEDHATPEGDAGPMLVERVQLSGLMTFFFSIFYLQWAINRYLVGTPS